jgi:glycosyltransferase involved in cell wall biosynthesis
MVNVSVIIPVYNAEKYLKDCIESLLRQTLPELEFIFVNDGSKDTSAQIIASYQATDSRITLINQPNQGVSVARNKGISIAKGEYIGFVDADDYVNCDMYEQLYMSAFQHEADVVVSSFYKEINGVFTSRKLPFESNQLYDRHYIKKNIVPYLIEKDSLNTSCPKLYKKSLLYSNEIFFPKGIVLGEDNWFNLSVFNIANKIFFTDYQGYYYREVEGSATRNLNKNDYFQRALEVFLSDYHSELNIDMTSQEITLLKGKRLITQTLSILSLYQNSENKIPFFQRVKYIKSIIKNIHIKCLINKYWDEILKDKNKFQKFNLYCMKNGLFLPLWFALSYSNYKNNKT